MVSNPTKEGMANLKKRKNKKQTKNNNIKKKIKQIIKNKKKKQKKQKQKKHTMYFNWTLFSCLVLFLNLDSEIDSAKELVSVILILQVRRAINLAL